MSKNSTAVSASQISENPLVLIKYDPANALSILAGNATQSLAKLQGAKITNARQLETSSEILEDARIRSQEVETFIETLREKVQGAAAQFRECQGFEDFEVTLTIRKWTLRRLLNDGISKLRGARAKFISDEQERVRREQQAEQTKQDRINREASDKAAKEATKLGADKTTAEDIRQTVLATPAAVVTSKALDTAASVGAGLRYSYTAQLTNLKAFLGAALNNPVLFATLAKSIPDIEKSFGSMARDQEEAFVYPGITFKKTPVDVRRRQ